MKIARVQIDALDVTPDQCRLDTRRYQSAEQGLEALAAKRQDEANWNDLYTHKSVPLGPWGKSYIYRIPRQKDGFDLLSFAKDGTPGSTGGDGDISSL